MNNKKMAAAAVICEFNPLHNGHAYLLSRMKKTADCVICVMSGRWVQRGSPAVTDPYLRAKMAVNAGADLVLELPFPWSISSAESFAMAGINIINRIDADSVYFGSESGDIEALKNAAKITLHDDFAPLYAKLCHTAIGSAAAYIETIYRLAKDVKINIDPNDLLGIAYLRAIQLLDTNIAPIAVKRQGDSYHDELMSDGKFPSATALRRLIHEAWYDADAFNAILDGTMPKPCLNILLDAARNGDLPANDQKLSSYLHAYYRLRSPDQLEKYAELSGGLAHRICRVANSTTTFNEFFNLLKNKYHTDSHLRRALIFGTAEVERADLNLMPQYTTLLAANGTGCEYLSYIKKEKRARIEIVTKPADAPPCRQKELGLRADALYTLCLPQPRKTAYLLRQTPYISEC